MAGVSERIEGEGAVGHWHLLEASVCHCLLSLNSGHLAKAETQRGHRSQPGEEKGEMRSDYLMGMESSFEVMKMFCNLIGVVVV